MARRDAYPLAWPENWPRTEKRVSSQFRSSLSAAVANVQDELRRFAKDSGEEISDLVISSNVTLADQRPADPGVAVYFTWSDLPTCIAVDRYLKPEDNLQAIAKVLEAERTKMRHGGLNLVRAAFRGYLGLPPPPPVDDWREVLGVPVSATDIEIERAYKRRRAETHPDRGGDAGEFYRVLNAWAAYERTVGR